jgi:phosphotriesterase-related protein
VDTVVRLCEAGYAESMVLSQDASCYIDWFPPGVMAEAAPNWHYEHIHQDVLPALRERGVTEAQIRTMLVDNPRRYFERVEAY